MGAAVAFEVLRPDLVAEIHGLDLANPIGRTTLQWLFAVWRGHAVLVFRNQAATPDAQLAFSRRLGVLDPAPAFDGESSHLPGYPEVAVVSNIIDDGVAIGGLGDSELDWHSDMTYEPLPPAACLLCAREVPSRGGDTYFLDMRAAWQALPAQARNSAARAHIFHDRAFTSAGTRRRGARSGEGAWHAVRRIDPLTGEPSLLLGRRSNRRITCNDPTLLETLWQSAANEEHVYRHAWRPGDVVLWNNLAVMHRRDAFDPSARRLLLRTQIRRLHPI